MIILLSLIFICAYGTILESQYDSKTALARVYRSWYFIAVLILLCLNLLAVMIDRLPWRPRHASFLLAHSGIIILLLGATVTYLWGIEGTLEIEKSMQTSTIYTSDSDLKIFKKSNDGTVTLLYEKEINIYKMIRFEIYINNLGDLKFTKGHPYGIPKELLFKLAKRNTLNEQQTDYIEQKNPTPMSHPFLDFEVNSEKHQVGLNSFKKFKVDDDEIFVTYGNKRLELPFTVKLLEFNIDRYSGTNSARDYVSKISINSNMPINISMNQPHKYLNYTFYQSSFQTNINGEPYKSILTVNSDPGRFFKYLGSLLVILGSFLLMFYKKAQN